MIKQLTQRQLLKMCYSKVKHNTLDEANLAGLRQIKQRKTIQTLYMYYCPNCNKFHLTHKPAKHRVI